MERNCKILIVSLAVFASTGFFIPFAESAQNGGYPSPAQCQGADWNIGLPEGITCSGSVLTGIALEQDSRATSVFGSPSRIDPTSGLAGMNVFCRQYTGDQSAYAEFGRMHSYCNSSANYLASWTGSSWSRTQVGSNVLNVQQVRCRTGCRPVCQANFEKRCDGNSVYWYDSCGTRGSLVQTCSAGQTCSGGICACLSHATERCYNNNVYWYNSCGNPEGIKETCGINQVCQNDSLGRNGRCVDLQINCRTDSDCGMSGYTGSPYCGTDGNVYKVYESKTCRNPGTANSYCNVSPSARVIDDCFLKGQSCDSSTKTCRTACASHQTFKCYDGDVYWYDSCDNRQELKQNCTANQTCNSNTNICDNLPVRCSSAINCGQDGYEGSGFCQTGSSDIYKNYKTWTCNNPGTPLSSCSSESSPRLYQACGSQKCSAGVCAPACSPHFSQQCLNSKMLYWYDSCGNMETLKQECGSNQICAGDQCQDVECKSSSDCGTNSYEGASFCQPGFNSIFRNFVSWRCENAGLPSSSCVSTTSAQQTQFCAQGEVCSVAGGLAKCSKTCDSHSTHRCVEDDNNVHWFNSCGNHEGIKEYCGTGEVCSNGECVDNFTVSCTATPNPAQKNQPVNFVAIASGSTAPYTYTWSGACVGSALSCQNVFTSPGVYVAMVTVVSGGASKSTPCSVNVDQTCDSHASKSCSNGNVYWYDACGTREDVFQTCTPTERCSGDQCVAQTITCQSNSDCEYLNGYSGSSFCKDGDVYRNYNVNTCRNAGTANSYCTQTATEERLTNDCSSSQTCQNGQCSSQTIICSSNGDCSSQNGYTGSPYCGSDGNVYRNYSEYTCRNAGTANSYCLPVASQRLTTTCLSGQTCSAGLCADQNIVCSNDSDCSSQNGYAGNAFCQGNSVYKNYTTHTCRYPGTANSYCYPATAPQKLNDCSSSQTCANGACSNLTINCDSNSDCGTNGYTGDAFCNGNSVYKNYKTWTCNNPGTASSSCSESTAPQKINDCSLGQTCSAGACGNTQSNLSVSCYATPNPVNTGNSASFIATASGGSGNYSYSWSGACSGSSQVCSNSFSQAGTQVSAITVTSGTQTVSSTCQLTVNSQSQSCNYHSYQRCDGNYLYWYDSCGTRQDGQYCQNGCSNNACNNYNNNYTSVRTDPATNVYSNQATLNGYLYTGGNTYCSNYVWFQYGPTYSYGSETNHILQNYSGAFSQTAYSNIANNYHFRAVAQDCSGNTVYGQDQTIGGANYGTYLSVTKTVRNLSTGTGWSTSTTASPGDVVMFMITVQANSGQSAQNVMIRDYFPVNLTYNNQMIVSGNTGAYTGDIITGLNFSSIPAGQMVTITYQGRLAPATSFSYGTTTLNNNVSVTSSNSSYNPVSNASVIVTRSGVFGASTISTGLTNNILLDSFILPLMIALLGFWMYKSGLFFGVEKWVFNKKKARKGYLSEKELSARISQIRSTEN